MRFGSVALVGRTNVGKSTFLNAVLGEELAVVSPLPQTTRETLLGVVHRPDAQIAFIDTPGLHRPRTELGRRMNASAVEALRTADLVLLLTDVERSSKDAAALFERDKEVLELLPAEAHSILVLNKVDLIRDKNKLLPLLDAYAKTRDFLAIVPASVRSRNDAERVLELLAEHLPGGEPGYEADFLTDRATPYFVREYVREQVLKSTLREVPHAVAVSVDAIEQREKVLAIKATIHVEKDGQRRIVVGKGGATIKSIGTGARKKLEDLTGQHIFLELFVRISARWKDVPRQLAELGYDAPNSKGRGP